MEESTNPALHAQESYRFIGCADFSKAFDRIHGITAAQALSRFRVPPCIWRTLLAAWSTQQHWLCTPQHAPDSPDLCQALPKGDPMSPLGLRTPLAEATAQIKMAHPTPHRTVYMDDRSWMTKQPLQCAQNARSWEHEAQFRKMKGKKTLELQAVSRTAEQWRPRCKNSTSQAQSANDQSFLAHTSKPPELIQAPQKQNPHGFSKPQSCATWQ